MVADSPPLTASSDSPNNLPIQSTSFVGREREVAEVKRLLTTTRLLTLTGAGGIGKTRLAVETTAELVDAYADGVWLVKLASLADPALIAQAVVTALGMRPPSDRSPLEALLDSFRDRELLLLLDNCEHLVTACAGLVETLLEACPRLRILVTSRQALEISGETIWRVPALIAPDPEQMPSSDANFRSSPSGEAFLARYGAVRLFVERARAARPGFDLTARTSRAIAQICQQLDGIPLAIELAAARVGMLTPEQIAARLSDRFRLLTGGSRTALPRHQTLRALVDWSYDLLEEPEQILLRRLAVFAGGWTLEAAEAVCADTESPTTDGGGSLPGARLLSPPEILDVLARLLMKSLVVAEEWRGEVRYRLLQTIREYAAERLRVSGEEPALRGRHRDWFLALAERTASELNGPGAADLYDRLEAELDNFRTALEWSVTAPVADAPPGELARPTPPAADAGLRLGAALHHLWSLRGLQSEGREWLARLLARTPGRTAARARALNTAGYMALRQGDYKAAVSLLEEGLTLSSELGDQLAIAAGKQYLGLVRHAQGDYVRATANLEESLALAQAQGNNARIHSTLLYLADLAYEQGDYVRAAARYDACLALARELGNAHNISAASRGLGLVALAREDLARAIPLLQDSLARSHELRDKKCAPMCIEALAFAAVSQGWTERAARLFGAAQALRDAVPVTLPPAQRADHERGMAAIRAALDEQRFSRAWAEGQAMTLDRATDYALLAADTAAIVPDESRPDDRRLRLTPREQEVVALIAQGLTNSQIAAELVLSVRTVERHIENIYEKVGVRGKAARAAIAAYALRCRQIEST
ncbi:MAG: tetratricopeptide repeat protein [Chloroflexota bacterium]|nr:tetratricopeptide repeat protein [Chloroflexota bacterium]